MTRPHSDLEVALGAFRQYVDTGDDCYLDNLNPEELRELAKLLGRREREKDPVLAASEYARREQAFAAAYPRLHCPACRKRISAVFDSIDADSDGPEVQMSCCHCKHLFAVPRNPS